MLDRTIYDAVSDAAGRLRGVGVDSPDLEAQLLLATALGMDRLQILTRMAEPISSDEWHQFDRLVGRRAAREPLAYICGSQEFYGLAFEVSPAVLIPRPETELVVDLAVRELACREDAYLVDVGTGSGCIAIAAATRLPNAHVAAVEISPAALEMARRNAIRHGVERRICFLEGDFRCVSLPYAPDMIVSNPPYIESDEIDRLQPEVRDYEPRRALDGGIDGFQVQVDLLAFALGRLRPGGTLAVEVGVGQSAGMMERFQTAGFLEVAAERDLQGIERIIHGRRA